MTKKLYWIDPYQNSFNAAIVSVDDNKIILDQTCFYPQGGGQVGDTGQIQELRVIDTQKRPDGEVVHILEKQAGLSSGQIVECGIDWDRRYRIMRLHSASHVMEYFLFKLHPGLRLLGSHVNEKHDESTYKMEMEVDLQKATMLNAQVSDFLARELTISVYSSVDNPDFRFWECGEIRMPCGGTHPRNTSEIGKIQIRYKPKGSDRIRVYTSFDSDEQRQ